MSRVYRVVVRREGGAWLADVPEAPGVQTWARSLARLDAHIREAVALGDDLPEGAEPAMVIEYEYRTGDCDLDAKAAEARAIRERVERERRELAIRTEELANELVRRHNVSVRDAATITGVSMQRISQLVGAGRVPGVVGLRGADATPG